MSLPRDSDQWSPSVARNVDAVCDRFERAHRAGQRPRVRDFLAGAPAAEYPILLRELLALDLAYRRRAGDAPTPDEYLCQFPDHAGLIGAVFGEAVPGPPDSPPLPAGRRPSGGAALPGSETTEDAGEGEKATPVRLPGTDTGTEKPGRAVGPGPGPEVPGYEILGDLGRGGMGVVYKARQVALKRPVALKMLLNGTHLDPERLDRFRAEAETVARLQHPNIVQVYEVGELDGWPFFSLELVEGGSLDRKLAGAPLQVRDAATLLETLARAMHHAHQRGLVHRDLKPANVLLAADGTPKITDFGLAKQLDADAGRTHSGAVVGTPSYMAPEQAEGKNREVGPAADVYALGAILYECLTGRPPFRGATVLETLDQVRTWEPVPPSRLQPGVPRDLETVCLKCLRKEPARRYASALDLAEDLRRFLAGEPVRARPTPAWERALKWARRRPAAAALLAVMVAALAGSVAGSLWYYRQQARETAKELAGRRAVQDLLGQGYQAHSAGDWQGADSRAGEALTLIQNAAPALDDLRADAEHLRDTAGDQLAREQRQAAREQARRDFLARRERFNHWRDEALFHGTLFTGVDLDTNVRASEKAVLAALGEFGVAPDAAAGPDFDATVGPPEKEEITARCYELLLVLAEARAQQGPGHAAEALRALDRAAQLARPTRAYYLRRARYLDLVGDAGGAWRARAHALLAPAGALDAFLMGEDQRGQGNLAAAAGHYQDALRSDPGHFWARYFLAICYLGMRPNADVRAARDSLTACLGQREFAWVYVLRGFAHGQLRQFGAAEADFGKAARLDPGDENLRYGTALARGAVRALQEDYAGAVAEYGKAARLKPDRREPHTNLAQVYERQKRPDLAVEQLNQALAVAGAKPAVLQTLYRTRAGLHERRNDRKAALLDLRRAIDQEPRASRSPQLAEDHVRCGRLLHDLGKYQDAVTAYDAALKVQPTLAAAHLGRCEALLALERYDEVVRSLDEHLPGAEKVQERARWYRVRAMVRAARREYAGAVEDYTRALDCRRDAATLTLRGWAYLFQDALTPALHDFREALELDPKNGTAYGGRGYALVRRGRYRQGVEDAETALACRPENRREPRLLCNAARVFAQAVGWMDAERGHSTRQALEERAAYQDRALQLLRTALETKAAGERRTFWRKIIAADTALGPIRGSPGYRQLEAEYAREGP
jgi:tetratricopeptide (TPR) repeat protein